MRYAAYITLLYIFLPFNHLLDLITIMIFFIVINENEWFAIVFSFFAGLLIDLYNPAYLGLHAFIHTSLVQALLYVKRFAAKDMVTVMAAFVIFFLAKVLGFAVVTSQPVALVPVLLTLAACLPLHLLATRLLFRTWTRQ